MPRPDFQAALDEARKKLDQGMPAGADQRLRARLKGGPPRPRRLRRGRVAAAAGVAFALGLSVLAGLRSSGGPRELGGFAVVEPFTAFASSTAGQLVAITAGSCALRDEALGSTIQLGTGSKVRRRSDGLEVLAGTVELDVDHQHPRAAPFRVRVSHGEIDVLGTRFIVVQGEQRGSVSLERGAIRFRASDGRERLLAPGQSVAWPLPEEATAPPPGPAPAPQVAAVAPRAREVAPAPKPQPAPPRAEPPPAFDAAALLDRIAVLRSRGQFEEAAAALTAALRERHSPATGERLSFELGAILTRQLRDSARACAHWRAHQQTFAKGRYEAEVLLAKQQLLCGD